MAVIMLREAINQTLHQEMERDPNIVIMGEDIVGRRRHPGGPEAIGGIWGLTGGLLPSSAQKRVIDTPISESASSAPPAGAALAGMRADRRTHVRRLRRRQHRPDLQPDGEVPLHVRRQDALPGDVSACACGAGMNAARTH